MEESRKRITVGLLVSGIMDNFTEAICRGVMNEAKKRDVNIVVFPAQYLDRDVSKSKELMYEYQYNTLFSYVKKENLDAILVSAGSIGCFTSRERVCEVLDQYLGIPCVLIASKMDGYVSVTYDNDAGIREAMEYLIHELNCRKFCILGGPDENTDAFERKQVFLSVLEEHGIPFEPRNLVESNLSIRNAEFGEKLLEQNPDADAIFCVNDDTALGLYKEMEKRGIIPGKDVYVFGYDNSIAAARSKPSLSSVWADAVALGGKSLDLLLRRLQGETVVSQTLPTKFIRRESFGSRDRKEQGVLDYHAIEEQFEEIFYRIKHEEVQKQAVRIYQMFQRMIEQLILLLEKESFDMDLYTEVQSALDDFLGGEALEYADMGRLLKYMEQIYQSMASRSDSTGRVFTIIFRKIIASMDNRIRKMKDAEETEARAMKSFVSSIMQFEKGNDKSYMLLLQNLDWLDIRNAYVYTFEEPITHLRGENFRLPEHFYLKAIRTAEGVESIPITWQKVKAAELFRQKKMMKSRYSMVLFPLFSNEVLYGAVLCDLTEKLFGNGEFLVNQMSFAAKMIELLKINEEIQEQLEDNLASLRQTNRSLDSLAKSDVLTGVMNRRGFQEAAEQFLQESRKAGKKVLVAYIDMNNLKIINDRYGHEEGDFSLKLIGELIAEAVRGNGICGRIGGDEFACLMECGEESAGQQFRRKLYDAFENYNRTSEKVYNISVSVGAYVLEEDADVTLNQALLLADERLYEEKQYRLKKVEK